MKAIPQRMVRRQTQFDNNLESDRIENHFLSSLGKWEIQEADFAQPEGELSEDELAVVSGGAVCFCFVGGGGKREEDASPCGCVLFGNGEDQSAFCMLVGAEVDTRHW